MECRIILALVFGRYGTPKNYVCISYSRYAYTPTLTGVQRIVWLHARDDTFAQSFWKKTIFCSHDEILALGIGFIRHIWFKNWTIFNDDGTIPDREVIDKLWGYDQPNEVLIMVLEREAPQSSRALSLSRSIHCRVWVASNVSIVNLYVKYLFINNICILWCRCICNTPRYL